MANLEKTVKIIFAGKDELSVTTRMLYRELNDFGGGVVAISGSLASLADNVLKINAAMNALAVGGLLYAYKKAVDFSSSTADLNKVLNDTEKIYLVGAQNEAMRLSEKFGESSSAILQSMANFKQAGFTVQDAMKLTSNSLDLVIAGDISAAEASDLLVASLKGFKAPASEASRLVDILNEVSNNYATDVRQLAIGMAALSPIAKTMGFTFEETAGVLTPVVEVFRSGDESARALKTGLLKLIDDSKPVQTALESIGVSQKDANGQLRSGKDILFDVATAFQKLDENQKLFVTQQIVGIDQSARMVEVFNGLSKSAGITNIALGATGSAAKEVSIRLAEPESVLKQFISTFDNFVTKMGNQYKNSFTGIIVGGKDLVQTLSNLVDDNTFAPLFDMLNQFANKTKDYLLLIAKNLPEVMSNINWDNLIGSFGNLGQSIAGAFQAIFGNLDLTTVAGLTEFVQKLVNAFAALNNMTSGIIDGMRPLFRIIGEGINQFSDISENTAEFAGEILGMAKMFYLTTTYLDPLSNIFTIFASSALIAPKIITLVSALKTMELSMFSLNATMAASPLALAAFAVSAGVAAGALAQYIPGVKAAGEGVGAWVYDLFHADEAQKALANTTTTTTTKVQDFGKAVNEVPKEKSTAIKLAEFDKAIAGIVDVKKGVDNLPSRKSVDVAVNLPTKSVVEESKTIQNAVEWRAKLDIAQVESATKQLQYAFQSIDNTISETSKSVGDVASSYADLLKEGVSDSSLSSALNKQLDIQEDAARQQEALIDAQIELMKTKTKKLEKGESLITIQADGMETEIEAFMWKILKKIEIRANEEAAEFLLGLPTT